VKIVYTIAGTYRAAGMEKVLADKVNWLSARGDEVLVVTTEQKGRPSAFPMDGRVRFQDLAIGYEDNNGGSFLSKAALYPIRQHRHRKRLSALLKEERPDLVVSMFCGDESFLPKIGDGSRKVLEVHFSRFKRLQYGRKGLWALADRIRSRTDLRHIRRFDRFVVLTEEDKGYWGGLDNIAVIPNSLAARPSEPSALDSRTVIAVGRFSYQKGLERLVDAWKTVKESPLSEGWKLRLVGDGECREALVAQVRRLALEDSVEVGAVEKDMDAVYRSASVLALPSRYEGLPMVLLESQAYGVPAVAFACKCGPRDVITPGRDGLLVPEGDVPAFAAALLELIGAPDRLKAMGAAAFEASARWDRDTIMQQWNDLFNSIL